MGEHLPCKQGVMGSNPIISIHGENTEEGRPLQANQTVEGLKAITAERATSLEAGTACPMGS